MLTVVTLPLVRLLSTTWLAQLSGGAPVKISDEDSVDASMNANYAVWGDPHAGATYLYELEDSGKLSPGFANCLRPELDKARGPSMVCLNFSDSFDAGPVA